MEDRRPDVQPGPRVASPPPSARQRAGRAGLVAGTALLLAIGVPPAGALLGVLAIVMAVRAGRAEGSGYRAIAAAAGVGGVAAVLIGSVLSLAGALLWNELRTYYDCSAGANTRQAAERCSTELTDAIEARLGFTIPR